MMSTSVAATRSRPAASVSATARVKSTPFVSRSASLMSRASPGLSSTSSTRTGTPAIRTLVGWQLDNGQPEVLDRLHHGEELVDIDRLVDVAIRVQVIRLDDVGLGVRRRQHHDRNPSQVGIFLDLGKHLAAVLAGQIEVEEDQVRAHRVDVFALPPQKGDRLDAV